MNASIPTIDDLIAFVREGGADVEALQKQYAEHLAKKAKAEADAEAKRVYEASAECYIKRRLNYMIALAMDEFSSNHCDGSVDLTFKRKDEWDAEKFDAYLNELVSDLECRLQDHDAAGHTSFTADTSMYHDCVGADGLCNEWEVSISWDMDLPNPFEDEYERDVGEEKHD